ncbi:MAG: hypothetical protein JWN17_510, partial [Frankiales bacterium]|nr:hypothetical protein [Frankiales bacterium]
VVLLLQHSDDDGALGVVLNRPSGTDVDEVLPGWQDLAAGPSTVFVGGPVQPEGALCLGRLRPGAAGTRVAPLPGNPLLATVDLDAPPDDVAPLVQRVRVFAGCAGWSPGQLEGEVEEGSWWVLDSLPGDPFTPEPDLLWRQVLRRQGGTLSLVSTYPEDPTHN